MSDPDLLPQTRKELDVIGTGDTPKVVSEVQTMARAAASVNIPDDNTPTNQSFEMIGCFPNPSLFPRALT